MRSPRTEAHLANHGEGAILLGMSLTLVALIVTSPGIGAEGTVSGFALAGLLVLLSCLVLHARQSQSRCLHMTVFMVFAGTIGLLLGARLDFGPSGLAAFADWCSSQPALSLDAVARKIAVAPWTYGLMLAGCNAGMALSAIFFESSDAGNAPRLMGFLARNIGMVTGMFAAEAVFSATDARLFELSPGAAMVSAMTVGMTLGMWFGWILTERLTKRGGVQAAA